MDYADYADYAGTLELRDPSDFLGISTGAACAA
jgi:hypothetical protein